MRLRSFDCESWCLRLFCALFVVREGKDDVWYYSTKAHISELMESLEGQQWETDLYSALQELKEDILKQTGITEELTIASKGCKKSVIEIETGIVCCG